MHRNTSGLVMVEIMIIVAIIGILVAIAVPGFVRAREKGYTRRCQQNLVIIQDAKEKFIEKNGLLTGEVITMRQLLDAGLIEETIIDDPSGYPYIAGKVGENPQCTSPKKSHSLTPPTKTDDDY